MIKSELPRTSPVNTTKNKMTLSASNAKLSFSLHAVKEPNTSPLSTTDTTTNNTSKYVQFAASEKKNAALRSNSAPVDTNFHTAKADLPGRVSFSKNDVYEIDYSDFENDTDTSRSIEHGENFRKKNVRFKDEYFTKYERDNELVVSNGNNDMKNTNINSNAKANNNINNRCLLRPEIVKKSSNEDDETKSEKNGTNDMYCCTLKCNSIVCKTEDGPTKVESAKPQTAQQIDNSEKIIEDYKREIENINRRHALELKWSGNKTNLAPSSLSEYLNNSNTHNSDEHIEEKEPNSEHTLDELKKYEKIDSWRSPKSSSIEINSNFKSKNATTSNASEDSPTRDSTSTVINNYLKAANQKTTTTPKSISNSTATIKLKTTKKNAPLQLNGNQRKIKSAQISIEKANNNNKLTKARSISCLQSGDNKLNEFQIEKVESWMSTHEDTFSETGLSTYRKGKFGSSSNIEYKKAWRETPTSKTDDEGNFSLDDQLDSNSMDESYGEIELVLKKMEGRRMKISFGIKT